MRRLSVLVLALVLCVPLASYAASIGGVETQGQGKFAIGLDQEFLFDRDMEKETLPDLWPGETLEFRKTEIDKMYRTMVKASYGILDNLDIYLKLGTADFEAKADYRLESPTDPGTGKMKIKGDNAFAYGVGLNGKYELKDEWFVGCNAQYLRHKNDFSGTDTWIGDDETTDTFRVKGDVTFDEWQVAPYIAKKLGNFIPYLGVKYSDLRAKTKIDSEDATPIKPKFKADDNVGVFVGTDYKIGENWKLNLEGRFVDETAMSFGATYKF